MAAISYGSRFVHPGFGSRNRRERINHRLYILVELVIPKSENTEAARCQPDRSTSVVLFCGGLGMLRSVSSIISPCKKQARSRT